MQEHPNTPDAPLAAGEPATTVGPAVETPRRPYVAPAIRTVEGELSALLDTTCNGIDTQV